MNYDRIAREAAEHLEHIAELAQQRDMKHALGAVYVALQESWRDGHRAGLKETGLDLKPFPLGEAELEALDECVMGFAETCNPEDPEEWAIRNQACEGIEKLGRASLDSAP